MNHIALTATLVEREVLRYTPAGVAAIEAVFRHEGEVIEAGGVRQLKFELDTITLGSLAQRIQALPLGTAIQLTGFIAPRSHRTRKLRIHITDFESGE